MIPSPLPLLVITHLFLYLIIFVIFNLSFFFFLLFFFSFVFTKCILIFGRLDEVGIDHWNELEDNYVFVYINPEKGSKKVLVKCLVMGNKLVVDALAQGASEPVHLEIEYDSC